LPKRCPSWSGMSTWSGSKINGLNGKPFEFLNRFFN